MLLLWSMTALASPVDIYGFGAPMMGRGMGGVAVTGNIADMVNNPSSLQRLQQPEFQLGHHFLRSDFASPGPVRWDTNVDGRIDELDTPLEPNAEYPRADGFSVGLGRPIGTRFGVGFVVFVPRDRLLRVHTFDASLPRYFMYDNRANTYYMALGFGFEQLRGLTIGGAVELSAKARYQVSSTLRAIVEEPQESDANITDVGKIQLDIHEMTLELSPDYAPVVSLLIRPEEWAASLKGLQFGVVYRGATGLPVDVDVDLQLDVGAEDFGELNDLAFSSLTPFQLAVFDHYVPTRVSLGAAYEIQEVILLYVDGRWTQWSEMTVNIAQVTNGTVSVPILTDQDIPIEDANAFYLKTKDTWDFRMGIEMMLPEVKLGGELGFLQPIFRGGYARTPSVLENLGANVTLMDTSRATYTVGAGVMHRSPFGWLEGPISWDGYMQWHSLLSSTLTVAYSDKYTPGAPIDGPEIIMNGKLRSGGLQARIQY